MAIDTYQQGPIFHFDIYGLHMGKHCIHDGTYKAWMDLDSQQQTWNLNRVLLTTTTTKMDFMYASITPQRMEFKATDNNKIGCDVEVEWMLAHKKN